MASNKTYVGNPPSGAAAIGLIDGFVVFNINRYNNDKYLGFKLVSEEPRKVKANYWISYRRDTKEFLKGGDSLLLVEHMPDMAGKMLDLVILFEAGLDDD